MKGISIPIAALGILPHSAVHTRKTMKHGAMPSLSHRWRQRCQDITQVLADFGVIPGRIFMKTKKTHRPTFVTGLSVALLVTGLIANINQAHALCNPETWVPGPCVINGKPGISQCLAYFVRCIPTARPLVGTVRPKYLVLTVLYAPPGTKGGKSSSSVSYSEGSSTGTTTSASKSFAQNYSVSVTAKGGFLGGQTATFGYGRSSTRTDSEDIKKSTTSTITVTGPPEDGINHDADVIYLWLNPKIDLTFSPPMAQWTFADIPIVDIQFVYVGWLKDPSQFAQDAPGVVQRLQLYGITPQDYPEILRTAAIDEQIIQTCFPGILSRPCTILPDPARYLLLRKSFPYEPPRCATCPVLPMTMIASTTDTTSTGSSVQKSYKVGATISGNFDVLALKSDNSWTWTYTSSRTDSTTNSESASVTVGGPSFGYTGPTDMLVYYDTIYKSYLFVPAVDALLAVKGTLRNRIGALLPGTEITLLADDGLTYSTFTNTKGEYRFYGDITGPLEFQVGETVLQARVQADSTINLSLP
jgi:hypothetical protein